MELKDEIDCVVDEKVKLLKHKLSDICGKGMIKMIFIVKQTGFYYDFGVKNGNFENVWKIFQNYFFFKNLFLTRHLIPMVLGGQNGHKGSKSLNLVIN